MFITCFGAIINIERRPKNKIAAILCASVAEWIGSWTCDQKVRGFDSRSGLMVSVEQTYL